MTTEQARATDRTDDVEAIERVVDTFFAAFTSGPDVLQRLDAMRSVLLPEAVVVRTCGMVPAVYDVESFIAPRQAILTDGTLTEFSEWPVSGRTDVFGDIAHHWGSYAKAGVQGGESFSGKGMKTIQLVRTPAGWRISAVAWDDERPGLSVDS